MKRLDALAFPDSLEARREQVYERARGIDPTDRSARIAFVVASMPLWEKGVTAPRLGEIWGISKSTVEKDFSEASSVVRMLDDQADLKVGFMIGLRDLHAAAQAEVNRVTQRMAEIPIESAIDLKATSGAVKDALGTVQAVLGMVGHLTKLLSSGPQVQVNTQINNGGKAELSSVVDYLREATSTETAAEAASEGLRLLIGPAVDEAVASAQDVGGIEAALEELRERL